MSRRQMWVEISLVLMVTFGASALRAVLQLTDALLDPAALNEQQVTLNTSQSELAWLDLALQVVSAGVLFAWGGLALYLLQSRLRPQASDVGWGAALAAIIGLPGLGLYLFAVQTGLSREIVPTGLDSAMEIPVLLLWSLANAFSEEIIVVMYLMSRLKGLGWRLPAILAASSILRGAYHLYQGISAGFGNIIMGVVYGYFYARTGRVMPLIIGHFLIDAVAFVGYAVLLGT